MDIVSWTFSRMREAREEPVSCSTETIHAFNLRNSKTDKTQVYIDANDTKRSLSVNEVWTLVRQLVAGLSHYGLVKGDTVCTVSFNDVST